MAEPTLAEIFRLAIQSSLLDVWTALPCRIESYDPVANSVEVLPMVRRAITDSHGNTQHEDLPVLPNVPVLFPRSSAFSATWPLAKGDFVLVIFCAAAVGNWRETGDISDPGDLRRHDLSFGFAIPGIAPKDGSIPTNPLAAVFEVNAPATHLTVGAGASDFVALAGLVRTLVGDLADAILNATTASNDGGAALQTSAKITLIGKAWPAGTFPPVGATAATKLKSE